jgi:hypothetical protein
MRFHKFSASAVDYKAAATAHLQHMLSDFAEQMNALLPKRLLHSFPTGIKLMCTRVACVLKTSWCSSPGHNSTVQKLLLLLLLLLRLCCIRSYCSASGHSCVKTRFKCDNRVLSKNGRSPNSSTNDSRDAKPAGNTYAKFRNSIVLLGRSVPVLCSWSTMSVLHDNSIISFVQRCRRKTCGTAER